MLAATLAMRRFALLFVINAALLTGYLSWLILKLAGFKETTTEPVKKTEKAKKKAAQKKSPKGVFRLTARRANMALGAVVVFFLSFFPNISPAIDTAGQEILVPSNAWCESLSWLKDSTPDPFDDPDFYYELCERQFRHPETAYGVLAWWDYGYWIIRIGHRLPNCDPGGGDRARVSSFFTAQDEASASKIIDKLNSRYVVIDHDTATFKFHAIASYAGIDQREFFDRYFQPQDGMLKGDYYFHPEYYRSSVVRLYNFDGERVIPESTTVISFENKKGDDGESFKLITDLRSFPNYEAARSYVDKQGSDNCRIVGTDPFISPVPLEALDNYKQVYSSRDSIMQPSGNRISAVKIFEYTK